MLPAASSSLRDASFSSLRASLASFSSSDCSSPSLPSIVELPQRELLRLHAAIDARLLIQLLHLGRDVLLFLRELLGLAQRVLDVPLRSAVHFLRELLLRFLQLFERRIGQRAVVLRAVGRRLPHRVGRILQLTRRVGEVGPLLLA